MVDDTVYGRFVFGTESPVFGKVISYTVRDHAKGDVLLVFGIREHDTVDGIVQRTVATYDDNGTIAVVRQNFGKTFYRTETFGLYIVIVDTFAVHVLLDFFPSFLYLSGTCFGVVDHSPFSRFYTHNRISILTVLTIAFFIFHRPFVNDWQRY